MTRENILHWEGLIFVEMFLAGVAAGAYVTATILEMLGRGRSPTARTAHYLAAPLMAIVGLLLTVDLSRPERFWHMVFMSEFGPPYLMFKPWSPMSAGTWGILAFSLLSGVSFVDALVDRFVRPRVTLHGSPAGLIWSLGGAAAAFFVAGYSGVLLVVTTMPGWSDSPMIAALYVATAGATGVAALLLIRSLVGRGRDFDFQGLIRVESMAILWQMLVLLLFVGTLGAAAPVFLTGLPLVALILAVVVGGVVPLLLLRFGSLGVRPTRAAVASTLVLVAGFLIRYAIVMGPQRHA